MGETGPMIWRDKTSLPSIQMRPLIDPGRGYDEQESEGNNIHPLPERDIAALDSTSLKNLSDTEKCVFVGACLLIACQRITFKLLKQLQNSGCESTPVTQRNSIQLTRLIILTLSRFEYSSFWCVR